MSEFDLSGFNITCISEHAVQIRWRSGKGFISDQHVDYKICSVIDAKSEIPGISDIVGLKVERVDVESHFMFQCRCRVRSGVGSHAQDMRHGWNRRGMMWETCDVTCAMVGE